VFVGEFLIGPPGDVCDDNVVGGGNAPRERARCSDENTALHVTIVGLRTEADRNVFADRAADEELRPLEQLARRLAGGCIAFDDAPRRISRCIGDAGEIQRDAVCDGNVRTEPDRDRMCLRDRI
jgi:hypothetical protein